MEATSLKPKWGRELLEVKRPKANIAMLRGEGIKSVSDLKLDFPIA